MLKYIKFVFLIVLSLLVLKISKIYLNRILFKSIKNNKYEVFKYYKNHEFMLNNNVIQYSSYLIIGDIKIIKIQSIIHVNYNSIKRKEDYFVCIVKSIKNNNTQELNATLVIHLAEPESKQVTCFLKIEKTIDLNELFVAIVRKDAYNDNSVQFKLINFQKPKVVNVLKKKIPKVGLCVQFVYKTPNFIHNWLRMQKDVGIAEIVLYDSTEKRDLHKYIDAYFVEVRPYNVDLNDICRIDRLNFNDNDSLNIFNKNCIDFHNREFSQKYYLRGKHDHMSSNLQQIILFYFYF